MSNPTNVFDIPGETLAQFLAKGVSDGTYADVLDALKVDAVGEEATATQIPDASGQLWSNMVDDFIEAAYPILRGITASFPPRKQVFLNQTISGVDQALSDPLDFSPVLDSVRIKLNGVDQEEGEDFSVSGTSIVWLAGTGSAVDLDTQDRLVAYYQG